MAKAFSDDPPFTLDKEADGRFRVRAEYGYIGNVFGGGRRWVAEHRGRRAGTFRTRADAALAVWVEEGMSKSA